MSAAEAGSFDAIQILVKSSADPSLRDSENQTAGDLAQINGHGGVAEFLRDRQPITTASQGMSQIEMSESEGEEYSYEDGRNSFQVPKPRAAPPPGKRSSNVDTGSWESDESEASLEDVEKRPSVIQKQNIDFNKLLQNFSSSEDEVETGNDRDGKNVDKEDSLWTESESQTKPVIEMEKSQERIISPNSNPVPKLASNSDTDDSEWSDSEISSMQPVNAVPVHKPDNAGHKPPEEGEKKDWSESELESFNQPAKTGSKPVTNVNEINRDSEEESDWSDDDESISLNLPGKHKVATVRKEPIDESDSKWDDTSQSQSFSPPKNKMVDFFAKTTENGTKQLPVVGLDDEHVEDEENDEDDNLKTIGSNWDSDGSLSLKAPTGVLSPPPAAGNNRTVEENESEEESKWDSDEESSVQASPRKGNPANRESSDDDISRNLGWD